MQNKFVLSHESDDGTIITIACSDQVDAHEFADRVKCFMAAVGYVENTINEVFGENENPAFTKLKITTAIPFGSEFEGKN